MLGTEGIAVGMSSRILPHNFPELLEAQIAILKKQSFKCLPDFQTGGLMDAREYKDGDGQIKVRAKIKVKDESTVVIKEIPPTTTTDSLIGSIEDASRKGKIKVKSINDFTSEEVEIEIKAPSGVSAEQLVDALYAFTDCEVTIASRIVVIKNNRPVEMTVSEVLRENTDATGRDPQARTGIEGGKLQDELHFRTLERIFIEERIYKKIEQCKTNEAVVAAVYDGFKPFRKQMVRDLADADVDRLLQVRIRRISLFDINKHREEMEKVKADLEETRKNLKNLTKYVIGHLEALLDKYGPHISAPDQVQPLRRSGCEGSRVQGVQGGLRPRIGLRRAQSLRRGIQSRLHEVRQTAAGLPGRPLQGDRLAGKTVRRAGLFTAACRSANAFSPGLHQSRGDLPEAVHLRRHDPEQDLPLHPAEIAHPVFRADTPAELYIQYKPAAYQKINQQTCIPSQVEVKGPKTRGRQISIKDVSSINSKPSRGWDPEAPTTKLQFI